MAGREERMQQRMRGAQRHQVQEASFDLLFDAPLPPPAPSSTAASTEGTPTPTQTQTQTRTRSAATAEEVAESPADAPGSGRRRSIAVRAAASRSAALQQVVGGGRVVEGPTQPAPAATTTAGSMFARLARARQSAGSHDDDDSPLAASAATTAAIAATTAAIAATDELSSPSLALVTGPETASSPLARKSAGARPRARRSRGSGAGATEAGAQATETPDASRGVPDDVDELSPEQHAHEPKLAAAEVPSSSPIHRPSGTLKRQSSRGRPVATIEEEPENEEGPQDGHDDNDDNDEAEEIDALEAARTLGRKRPRRSTAHEPSPELGSDLRRTAEADETGVPVTTEEAEAEPEPEPEPEPKLAGPPAKRRRRQEQKEKEQHLVEQSASGQNRQTKGKQPEKMRPEKPVVPRKRKPFSKKRARDDDDDNDAGDADDLQVPRATATPTTRRGGGRRSRTSTGGSASSAIPIAVQRFVRRRPGTAGPDADSDNDNDELADAIPFGHRSGVNAVDVLAQIGHDLIAQKLQDEEERRRQAAAEGGGDNGDAAASRRAALVRRAALDAFRQQLTSRLLEQAVAVDALHALRQRVRAAHREKLALRAAILRVRAERDQVALRMDTLRAHHQAAAARVQKQAALSTAMHDVDLAVEQGRAATAGGPPLTAAQQKTAELENLPLVASRVAEQVSGRGGGALDKIVAFNAFLARAAAVLEGRKRQGA